MLTAWLGGLLGGSADPKTYPPLSDLIGEEPEPESEPDAPPDEEAAHVGAKLWIMFLNR